MKSFIATADIHIWIRKDVPEEWQMNRYYTLFDKLIELCGEYDADLILAGDLWEKAHPSPEEISLGLRFFRMLREAEITVYAVSGNHETFAAGVDTFSFMDMGRGKTVDIYYGQNMQVPVQNEYTVLHLVNHCNLEEYMRLPRLTNLFGEGNQHILISHFRCNYNQFVREEIDVDALLEPFDLCIAGDIHAPYETGKLIYTNTPINKEFQRSVECGVLLLTIDKGTSKVERIPLHLPSLVLVTCTAEEYKELDNLDTVDFYKIEVSGTVGELKEITSDSNKVKLVKQPVTDEVLVDIEVDEEEIKDVPLEQELYDYMQTLGYDDYKRTKMLGVFHG